MQSVAAADVDADVARALAEDIGSGDLSDGLVAASSLVMAEVRSRDTAVLCGSAWFTAVFRHLDAGVDSVWLKHDGNAVAPGDVLCRLQGPARAILTGERTALNFLQTLSGTATHARRYAEAVAGTHVRVLDTRKTLPGLRLAQKYAVRCGGCHNHRLGLYDGLLIKENHIAAAGSISAALAAAKCLCTDMPVEIEVENCAELRAALTAGARRVLLDNFTLKALRTAVQINGGQALLEASGGITLKNIRRYAETGVDCISVGALTKDVRAVDLSLRVYRV